jgi:hypothetical protein
MKKQVLACLILSSIRFSSCGSSKTFLKNEQIPEDFGKGNKMILIIPTVLPQKGLSKKVDKAVLNAFEKYYKGPYALVGDNKKANNLGYSFSTFSDYNPGSFVGRERIAPSTDIYFGVTDIASKKVYKMNRFGNYIKFSKLYVQALEIVRKRNNNE